MGVGGRDWGLEGHVCLKLSSHLCSSVAFHGCEAQKGADRTANFSDRNVSSGQLRTGNARVRTQQDQASRGRQPSKREVSSPGHLCMGRGLNAKI